MNHWLMKTEPHVFGIDDLERVRIEPWTGVRNTWARSYMQKEMAVGDAVLFYHSSPKVGPPGVAGLARVHRTGVVDETQFDPASPYHDEQATRDAPVWWCVDVEFVERLPRLVALDELRGTPGLEHMAVLRIPRLSVQPVTAEEYAIVVARAQQTPVVTAKPKPKPKRKKRGKGKGQGKGKTKAKQR